MDEWTKQQATDHLEKGELEEAGKLIGLEPVAKKYGHEFDESPNSYTRRLQAALGLPQNPMEGTEEEAQPEQKPAPEPPEREREHLHEVDPDDIEEELEEEDEDGKPKKKGKKK